jgi:hypothetical protein
MYHREISKISGSIKIPHFTLEIHTKKKLSISVGILIISKGMANNQSQGDKPLIYQHWGT